MGSDIMFLKWQNNSLVCTWVNRVSQPIVYESQSGLSQPMVFILSYLQSTHILLPLSFLSFYRLPLSINLVSRAHISRDDIEKAI
jgi:hypothetical protein